ncbi:cytochrome P450 716B1 [Populus trichocarpa]|uniref:cytochrome P450 716B1 n=1 Tax=Populus trichocarpa TaxID=3694 RepID=UPI000D188491|nr:cytochrome P450 716B1 [Populus trichocarpa]|eukprot:XP_002317588.2 cytochrome P450 716B1 [Populus trichocarpa]
MTWHPRKQSGPTLDDVANARTLVADVAGGDVYADWSDDVADDCAELLAWQMTGCWRGGSTRFSCRQSGEDDAWRAWREWSRVGSAVVGACWSLTKALILTRTSSLRDQNNGEEMTEKEIVDNVILVLTAGHDTSAILITFLIRDLSMEPSIYAVVLQEHEEIAKSKSKGELLTWEDLGKMKYTWKVALEALRMFPPIFGGFRKAVKDIEYDGYIIPEGWQIFWTMNMTHMDDSIFTEPSKFDPTRFDNQASIPPYSFIGFGAGPRMCPGYEFAKTEALVTIQYPLSGIDTNSIHVLAYVTFGSLLHSIYENIETSVFENN